MWSWIRREFLSRNSTFIPGLTPFPFHIHGCISSCCSMRWDWYLGYAAPPASSIFVGAASRNNHRYAIFLTANLARRAWQKLRKGKADLPRKLFSDITLTGYNFTNAPVAQWIERLTSNLIRLQSIESIGWKWVQLEGKSGENQSNTSTASIFSILFAPKLHQERRFTCTCLF